jgi:hypothetical protein
MRKAEKVAFCDHLEFSNGRIPPKREPIGPYPVYGANGVIGHAGEYNARGPLIVIGRVGSYCGSVHYCSHDAWVTDNALICRAKNLEETRYWYYALQTCGLNRYRLGSGQPLLNHSAVRNASIWAVAGPERRSVGEILGALDDKIAAHGRVIDAAEKLMLAIVECVADRTPLSSFASRSTACLAPREFDDTVAHFSFAAFDDGAGPKVTDGCSIKSGKYVLSEPCVLFPKLNPRVPRVWNVTRLPPEMALASTEFVVLRPEGVDASAMWSAVRQPDVVGALQRRVAGMTGSRQRIQPEELLDVPVRDVRHLATESAQTLTSLGALCQSQRTESARAAGVRDALLPNLTSGKLPIWA